MCSNKKLLKPMTLEQFDNGYWYTKDLKLFAKDIGIKYVSNLRKDELEKIIRKYLKTSKVEPINKKSKSIIRDLEKGLSLQLPIIHYTNNRETENFIMSEALKIVPNLKYKSGVKYRLNRWREQQINLSKKITYKDLVDQYIKLNQFRGSFEKIPHGRYINFISEYFKNEKNATKEQAIEAWKELKNLNIPKEYSSWAKIKKRG